MKPLASSYYKYIKLLELSPFERRGGRWRFGARSIGDSVIARLIASGRPASDGRRVCIVRRDVSRRPRDAQGRYVSWVYEAKANHA